MRMDANLATAIALSESLAAAEKDPEVPMDDRIIAVARLERRIAYMDGQIDVLTSQQYSIVFHDSIYLLYLMSLFLLFLLLRFLRYG